MGYGGRLGLVECNDEVSIQIVGYVVGRSS